LPSIGLDAVMLLGEQFSGAAKPGLDLAEDQHHVMRGTVLAYGGEIARRRGHHHRTRA
jgi:hypothetical protein